MGTKIGHAIDPLLATSTNSNSSFTSQYRVDDWNYLKARKLNNFLQKTNNYNNFSDSMDRMLEKHNMESIKKTMQIHEEIFNHQLQELHRLYNVQKRWMGELKKESNPNTRIWNSSSSEMNNNNSQFFINNKRITNQATTTQINSGHILHFHQNVTDDDDATTRERRYESCPGETTIMKMARAGAGFDLEKRPAAALEEDNNYISTAFSAIDEELHVHDAAGPSNKMSNANGSDDDEVELTLSIGVSSSSSSSSKNKKKSSKGYQLGCLDSQASFKSDKGEDSSCPNTPMSSSSATFDQGKKMPHWLLGLSINRS